MMIPPTPPVPQSIDTRIHCDYAQLVRLQSQSQSFHLLPNLKAGSALSGRHHSLFRGRGLNFEELRHYQLGDDIRNLDWKVTMRTGKPHVRTYTEEKDRDVMIVVDQRSAMFFSSVEVMKSVVAAEIAALCAWRVLKDSDRVGFLIADHRALSWSKSKRSQNDVLAQLKKLAKANQELSVSTVDQNGTSFDDIVQLLLRLKLRSTTLIIISDWSDASEQNLSHLTRMQQHNDVLAIMVSDHLEQQLPSDMSEHGWVMGNGQQQLSIQNESMLASVNRQLTLNIESKREQLSKLMRRNRIPLVEVDTSGTHLAQFKKMIGGS
ncbi:MoxR protein [Vibrio sp. 10N.286.49.C2]|uniref:DUF58 domain-containing protein n=1 Tax=unclassified Vibrio TaxID=2614977 RepID=UPI000C82CF56|nr:MULTISPECIES: DUF58 domain-containing protein [unclassified Vibrio]PMH34843.1 MoxR protein [Vibrio sp. 10N.286.49.C2]PMH51369.1 MoxR protein [Vibrio sp. 10N.286.49.B1]PMH78656.1 MoxR protein [Vibrio sp. 10N.286.48.B7]